MIDAVDTETVTATCVRARRELSGEAMLARDLAIVSALNGGRIRADETLVDVEGVLNRRFAGARRLPRPLDIPDRAVLKLRPTGWRSW
jgi:hypothetical protein